MRQNCNNSATLQDGIPQSPCSSFMEMKNENISKTSVYKKILHLKAPVTLLLFTGSLLCEIPKSPLVFKEWFVTERLITKESSSLEIEKN